MRKNLWVKARRASGESKPKRKHFRPDLETGKRSDDGNDQ